MIHTGDGLAWLLAYPGTYAVATSPPDASELGMDLEEYDNFLHDALEVIFARSAGPTVLVVTDRKHDGVWLSKPAILAAEAEYRHLPLLWHRIALRRPAGSVDLHVPSYSHVLAYGPGRPGKPRPDVFTEGRRWWPHGVGLDLAEFIASWCAEVGVQLLLDPFAGTGSILWAAQRCGLEVAGAELDPVRAETARERLGHA